MFDSFLPVDAIVALELYIDANSEENCFHRCDVELFVVNDKDSVCRELRQVCLKGNKVVEKIPKLNPILFVLRRHNIEPRRLRNRLIIRNGVDGVALVLIEIVQFHAEKEVGSLIVL